MQMEDLPDLTPFGAGKTEGQLEELFSLAATGDGPPFIEYVDVVRGAPQSMRVFSAAPLHRVKPLPRAMGPIEVAQALMKLAREEARYPPEPVCQPGAEKGWELSQGRIGDATVMVAKATWVS